MKTLLGAPLTRTQAIVAAVEAVLRYEVVDVFTDRPYAGNPLAVVLGADELSTTQLQALAREFNLSETAFPMAVDAGGVGGPGGEGSPDYVARIFTPEVELPFAGHPSIGTAWVLASQRRIPTGRVVQRCGAGDLPLDVAVADGRPSTVTLTGGAPTVSAPLDGPDSERLLAAVGLAFEDLAGVASHRAGAGLEWAYLTVRAEAVARAVGEVAAMRALGDLAPAGIYLHAVDGADVHARAFAGDVGVVEDPATGSAALGLGVHLVACGLAVGEGTTPYVIRQGLEMGRPSTLYGEVDALSGTATVVRVAGRVVPVASGTIRVP